MKKSEINRIERRKAILEKVKTRNEKIEQLKNKNIEIIQEEEFIEDYYIEELRNDLIRDGISISRSTLARDIESMEYSIISNKMGPLVRVHYKKK